MAAKINLGGMYSLGFNNKFNQLNTANTELEAKYTAKIKLFKSNIKILKRKATLAQKASSANKVKILFLEAKICELEGKLEDIDLECTYYNLDVMEGKPDQINLSDPKEIDFLRLELERAKEDLNSKEYTIEYIEKEKESSDSIYKWEIYALRKVWLNSIEENSRLQEIITKKDNEIAVLSNPPPPSMNDSLQKLPDWLSDDLRPLVYEHGLEDKVIELNKSFARKNILETLQELLP